MQEKLKTTLQLSKTVFSKQLIRLANINVRTVYNELKIEYYNKLTTTPIQLFISQSTTTLM